MIRRTRFLAMIIASVLILSSVAMIVSAATPTGDQVVKIAEGLMGKVKYAHTYDPANLKLDCSGFTFYVFKQAGIDLKTADDDAQAWLGVHVDRANLQKGDLVFFNSNKSDPSDFTHVGIYYGDNKIIHNTSGVGGVVVNDLSKTAWLRDSYVGARRVIGVPVINVPKDGKDYVVTDHGWVSVKSSPSGSSTTIGQLLFPRPYQLLGKVNAYYYKVLYNGRVGYVTTSSTYVHAYYASSGSTGTGASAPTSGSGTTSSTSGTTSGSTGSTSSGTGSTSSTTGGTTTPTFKSYVVTDHGWVNVRSKPSLSSTIIGRLTYPQKYELIRKYNNYYYEIRFNGKIGYVTTSPTYVHAYYQ